MEQALLLPKTCSLFKDESEERILQTLLDRLSQKKITWEEFEKRVDDPLAVSRIIATRDLRTLLHLAVLDNRINIIQLLKNESILKSRRDQFGLSPIDLAKLLDRKEMIPLLDDLVRTIPEMPSLENFEYLSHPVFENSLGLEEVIEWVAKAKQEDNIPSEKIWMGIYFDKEIRNGLHAQVQIQKINDEIGFGVFATKKIAPCSFVGEYTGVIQKRSPKQLKNKDYVLRYPIWEGKKNYCIDAEFRGNFTRFINHSSNPNLGVQSVYWRGIPRMIFIAMKEIQEGNQLTFDYGPLFWKNKEAPNDL